MGPTPMTQCSAAAFGTFLAGGGARRMSVNVGGGQFSTAFGGTMVFGKLLQEEIVI